jgi:FkbM family methyltransferase
MTKATTTTGPWKKFKSELRKNGPIGVYWRNLSSPLTGLLRMFHWRLFKNNRNYRRALFDSSPLGSLLLSTTGNETYLVSSNDRVIGRKLFMKGNFEFDKFEAAISLLGKDFQKKLLIDIGSNIGIVCIPAVKRQIFQNAIAVEPEPSNYSLLLSNINLNGLGSQIIAHNFALGAVDGQDAEFELSDVNYGDHRIRSIEDPGRYGEEKRKTIKVRTQTFDSLIGNVRPNETLIWMDTQGYEGFVLAGATKALEKQIPLVIEFWPYGMNRVGSYASLKQSLLRSGYTTFYDLNATREPQKLSEEALDAVFNRVGEEGDYTDLLII